MASWKTTAGGVVLFLSILFGELQHGFDDKEETQVNWNNIVAAIGALWLGYSARDNNITSKRAGAK